MKSICISCGSERTSILSFVDETVNIKGKNHPLLYEYTKCNACQTVFITKTQVEHNKSYLASLNGG